MSDKHFNPLSYISSQLTEEQLAKLLAEMKDYISRFASSYFVDGYIDSLASEQLFEFVIGEEKGNFSFTDIEERMRSHHVAFSSYLKIEPGVATKVTGYCYFKFRSINGIFGQILARPGKKRTYFGLTECRQFVLIEIELSKWTDNNLTYEVPTNIHIKVATPKEISELAFEHNAVENVLKVFLNYAQHVLDKKKKEYDEAQKYTAVLSELNYVLLQLPALTQTA